MVENSIFHTMEASSYIIIAVLVYSAYSEVLCWKEEPPPKYMPEWDPASLIQGFDCDCNITIVLAYCRFNATDDCSLEEPTQFVAKKLILGEYIFRDWPRIVFYM